MAKLIQLIGPISNYLYWQENFDEMEAQIKKAFKTQKNTEVEVINPKIFSDLSLDQIRKDYTAWANDVVKKLKIPISFMDRDSNKTQIDEAYFFALSFLTIPGVDYIYISKLSSVLSVGSAIETLWASKFQVAPIFEVHIQPDELYHAFKNAVFLCKIDEKDVDIFVDLSNMSLSFYPTEEFEKHKDKIKDKVLNVLHLEYNKDEEKLKAQIKGIIDFYKKHGFYLFLNEEDKKVGVMLTFNLKQPA